MAIRKPARWKSTDEALKAVQVAFDVELSVMDAVPFTASDGPSKVTFPPRATSFPPPAESVSPPGTVITTARAPRVKAPPHFDTKGPPTLKASAPLALAVMSPPTFSNTAPVARTLLPPIASVWPFTVASMRAPPMTSSLDPPTDSAITVALLIICTAPTVREALALKVSLTLLASTIIIPPTLSERDPLTVTDWFLATFQLSVAPMETVLHELPHLSKLMQTGAGHVPAARP